MPSVAQPTSYEIRIRGVLSAARIAAFPELSAEAIGGQTVLVGALPDQAALFGVLAEMKALGLELLEVRIAASSCEPGDASTPHSHDDPADAARTAFCRVRIDGVLSATLLEGFRDLMPEQRARETLLAGPMTHPAALYGVLARIEALGLTLLEARCEPADRPVETEVEP